MYNLVVNIDDYQEFVPWCRSSTVLEEHADYVIARLQVHLPGYSEELITRNTLEPHQRIGLELVQGPFSYFDGEWRFVDLTLGCKAILELQFKAHSRLFHLFAKHLAEATIDRVLNAFTSRANSQLVPCK